MSTRCTGSDRVLSLHWKDVCFKTGCAFQDNKGKSLWDEGSFHSCLEQNHEDWGGSFHSMECVTGTLLSFVQSKSAIIYIIQPNPLSSLTNVFTEFFASNSSSLRLASARAMRWGGSHICSRLSFFMRSISPFGYRSNAAFSPMWYFPDGFCQLSGI